MFGIITSIASTVSLLWPFINTIKLLTNLKNLHDTPIASLTNTISINKSISMEIQELMSYWILLSIWFYIIQLPPISFLINILPFSSFLIIYIQFWLGVAIIPVKNKYNGIISKSTGASIIYHYYFDNNMEKLNNFKLKLLNDLGIMGLIICNLIDKIPVSNQILLSLGIDMKYYKKLFQGFVQNNENDNNGGISHTMNNVSQLWGLVYSMKDVSMNIRELPNPTTTTNKSLISALFAPFGYTIFETEFEILTHTNTNVNPNINTNTNSTNNTSPTRSFDDFDIVSKGDLNDSNSDLNSKIKKTRSESNNSTLHEVDNSGLLESVKRVASGASNTAQNVVNRKSSWFSRSSSSKD